MVKKHSSQFEVYFQSFEIHFEKLFWLQFSSDSKNYPFDSEKGSNIYSMRNFANSIVNQQKKNVLIELNTVEYNIGSN